MAGTILDTDYQLAEEPGGVVVRVTKVAVGPMTEEDAAGIGQYGDISGSWRHRRHRRLFAARRRRPADRGPR